MRKKFKNLRLRNAFPLNKFIKDESIGGVILLVAAFAALVFVNTGLSSIYAQIFDNDFTLGFGRFAIFD